MMEATLDASRSRLLGALTIAAAQRLGGETFKDQGGQQPSASCGCQQRRAPGPPGRHHRAAQYQLLSGRGAGCGGARRRRKEVQDRSAAPPDLHLQLAIWFDFVATLLLGALRRHNPALRDRLRVVATA